MATTYKIFQYGDLEAIIDLSDFRVLERIDEIMGELPAEAKRIEAIPDGVAKVKALFYIYAGLLDKLFSDENAANKALGNSCSLDEAMDAVFAFLEFTRAQDDAMGAKWQAAMTKYAPNRAQRRAGNKA